MESQRSGKALVSDYNFEPGTAVVPSDEYLDELRKRVCGSPDQLAEFE